LNQEIDKALDSPQVRRRLEQEAIITEKMSPAQFTRFVEAEIAKWGPLARAAIGAQSSGDATPAAAR
jgi:tripartite-type tricarboxylate transporter receptor subunit TctC